VEITALSWNLFHGRDFPPDPALFTTRSRLLRSTERNATHVQTNRELLDEFAGLLSEAHWDVALLQECPPRWGKRLAAACDAHASVSRTSRNWFPGLQSAIARWNPDLIASWEGGSNAILLRGPLKASIVDVHTLVLRRRPERRTMGFVRGAMGLCVANLHASTIRALATQEVRRAAETATEWAGDRPLILGGDFNLRPDEVDVFDELAARFHLRGVTAPDAIDHILARGLEAVGSPKAWPAEAREVSESGLAMRLSDHAPVEARFLLQPGEA
jgi:endonuclease/exonuclease/phosphatase family metal-dependent hydrolase